MAHDFNIRAENDGDHIKVECCGVFSIRVPLSAPPNIYGYVRCISEGVVGRVMCRQDESKGDVAHSLSFLSLDVNEFSLQAFIHK